MDYFLKQGKRRIAVFYQNDAYGLNGRDGVERRLIKYDLGLAAEASYIRGESDVVNQVREIKKSNPDVVVMIGTAEPCSAFILEAVRQGMEDVFFSSVSFVGGHELANVYRTARPRCSLPRCFPPYLIPLYRLSWNTGSSCRHFSRQLSPTRFHLRGF